MGIILEKGQAVMIAYYFLTMPFLFFTASILTLLGMEADTAE